MKSDLSSEIKGKRIWDSNAEAYDYLQEIINTDHFQIFPHLAVSEVFRKYKNLETFKCFYGAYCDTFPMKDQERNVSHFELTHFDFVIYNKSQYQF